MRLSKIQNIAVTALEDIKARDIVVLDVRQLTSLYEARPDVSRQEDQHGRGDAPADRSSDQPTYSIASAA